jgi:hypothetical protein
VKKAQKHQAGGHSNERSKKSGRQRQPTICCDAAKSYSITFQGGFKPIELQTAGQETGLSPSQAFAPKRRSDPH